MIVSVLSEGDGVVVVAAVVGVADGAHQHQQQHLRNHRQQLGNNHIILMREDRHRQHLQVRVLLLQEVQLREDRPHHHHHQDNGDERAHHLRRLMRMYHPTVDQEVHKNQKMIKVDFEN